MLDTLRAHLERHTLMVPLCDCLLWTGSTNGRYGIIQLSSPRRNVLAHRANYMVTHQVELKRSEVVMHLCDNPLCVNTAHLKLGSQADNMRDMASKGRASRGDVVGAANGRAIVTAGQVAQIRALQGSHQAKEVGGMFNISASTVRAIWKRRIWRHL